MARSTPPPAARVLDRWFWTAALLLLSLAGPALASDPRGGAPERPVTGQPNTSPPSFCSVTRVLTGVDGSDNKFNFAVSHDAQSIVWGRTDVVAGIGMQPMQSAFALGRGRCGYQATDEVHILFSTYDQLVVGDGVNVELGHGAAIPINARAKRYLLVPFIKERVEILQNASTITRSSGVAAVYYARLVTGGAMYWDAYNVLSVTMTINDENFDNASVNTTMKIHPKIFGSADAKTVVVTYAAFGCWDDGLGNATCSRSPTIGGGGASIFEYVAKGNTYEEVYVLPSAINVTQDAGNYSVNLYGDVQFAAVSADGKRVVLPAGYGILRVLMKTRAMGWAQTSTINLLTGVPINGTLFVLGVSFSKDGRYLIVQSQDDGALGHRVYYFHDDRGNGVYTARCRRLRFGVIPTASYATQQQALAGLTAFGETSTGVFREAVKAKEDTFEYSLVQQVPISRIRAGNCTTSYIYISAEDMWRDGTSEFNQIVLSGNGLNILTTYFQTSRVVMTTQPPR